MERLDWRRQLSKEAESILSAGASVTDYINLLREALSVNGGLVSDSPRIRWARLVLGVCECASGGRWNHALPAATGLEILAAALELFDDLEDEDSRLALVQRDKAQATNAACGLMMLSMLAINRLFGQKETKAVAPLVCQSLLKTGVQVGAGQHLDLLYQGDLDISQDKCLAVASLKSAELMKCACEIGARLGTIDERAIALYAVFGWHLGMFGQLMNDVEGIRSTEGGKSDIGRLKATVPIAFWLSSRQGSISPARFHGEEAIIRREIQDCGALHYTWAVADTHRQQAEQILGELDQYCTATSSLGYLLEPVEPAFG